jgi:hypothetical protein
LAAVPVTWILYEASKKNAAGEEPYLTQLMRKLDYMQEVNRERNILHAHLTEQAAADRILFAHSEVAPQRRRVSVSNLEYVVPLLGAFNGISDSISQDDQRLLST